MRIKKTIKEVMEYWIFAFYPAITLITCTAFSVVVIAILGIMMVTTRQNSNLYNVVFALTTGAMASFFVTVVVEMSSNFKHNKLAWHELQDYYKTLIDYEGNKQVMMQLTSCQRAEKKAHEEFATAGGTEEMDEDDEPKDIIQITWRELPHIIPIFRQTLKEKKEFLSDEEIDELKNIFSEYEQIRFAVEERILLSPMTYDALNHPDEEYLRSIYPEDVIKNMPEWIRKYLSSKESEKACKLYVDAILSDAMLLLQFMENYDVSETGLKDYQNKQHDPEEALEDIDYDEIEFYEPDDEQTFRTQIEELDKQMEIEQRTFVSWQLSLCCQNIAKSVDILEKCISKKPYYGMMITYWKNSKNEPIDSVTSRISYESTKRQLDKRLAKQKVSEGWDGEDMSRGYHAVR